MENDTTNENLNSTNEEVQVDTEETTDIELETEENDVDVEQLQATNKKLYERAKKAEQELKALRGTGQPKTPEKKAPSQINSNPTPPVDVDERVLKANGMSDELLTKLKAIAKVEKIGLIEAQGNDLFVAYKEKLEREDKAKKASLGASRGSGKTETKKSFNSSNLPEDEHKALWRERMGK